jgi:hypothetical protein
MSMVAEVTMSGANTVNNATLLVHGFGPWGNARNAAAPLAEGKRGRNILATSLSLGMST